MILNDDEIKETMESPINLMNRLKHITRPSHSNLIPSLPPSADEIIEDLEDKLNYGSIKSKAAKIMTAAMTELERRMPEVAKPERLASIAAEMSKVVNASSENKSNDFKGAQIIIYSPTFRSEDAYDVIRVSE